MQRFLALCCLVGLSVHAGLAGAAAAPQPPKVAPAPPRQEGDGPYSQLILRNATVINGTGAPVNFAVAATLEDAMAVLPGYQLELFLNKPAVTSPEPRPVEVHAA